MGQSLGERAIAMICQSTLIWRLDQDLRSSQRLTQLSSLWVERSPAKNKVGHPEGGSFNDLAGGVGRYEATCPRMEKPKACRGELHKPDKVNCNIQPPYLLVGGTIKVIEIRGAS